MGRKTSVSISLSLSQKARSLICLQICCNVLSATFPSSAEVKEPLITTVATLQPWHFILDAFLQSWMKNRSKTISTSCSSAAKLHCRLISNTPFTAFGLCSKVKGFLTATFIFLLSKEIKSYPPS